MNINLHIERLVLDGVAVEPHQRTTLKTAVESELRRLLVSNGIGSAMPSSNSLRVVSGGYLSIERTHEPASLGKSLGNTIYQGIRK